MTTPPRAPSADRSRLVGWIVVGVLAVAVAGLLAWLVAMSFPALGAGSGNVADEPRGEVRPPDPSSPQAASRPEQTSPDASLPSGLAQLVDPAWVARLSDATGIPSRALLAYAGADLRVREETGCAVGWNTLAGIGLIESEHGAVHGGRIEPDGVARPHIFGIPLDGTRSAVIRDTDRGAVDGDTEWDRAVGPMQFIPDTWARWGSDGDGDGVADIHQIDDAALSAARYLCHARGSLDSADEWIAAIRSYNDDEPYLRRVSDAATHYGSLAEG